MTNFNLKDIPKKYIRECSKCGTSNHYQYACSNCGQDDYLWEKEYESKFPKPEVIKEILDIINYTRYKNGLPLIKDE